MAGWAAGADRQSRLSGRLHPKDRNEEEEPGLPGLRLAAAGLEGSDAHPAIQTPEANAIALAR